MTLPRSAADVLADHVLFEVEAIDRMYLNLYQPRLQHGAGIAAFFVGHRGHRFASSALMAPMTAAFTADIGHFVAARGLDLVRFGKGQRKDDLTREYLRRAELDDRGLDTARKHRVFAFYHLDAYTGARRGELLNLRWRDIDLDLAEVRITGSAAVIGGQRIEGTTKSGRSRIVSIDPGTVQVLRDHRKRQAQERLKVGPEWRGTDDYVFSTAWGEPVHPDTVSSLMTTLTNTHNEQQSEPLPHARLHDLRHVHATTLLLAGVPVHVVAARLGHADPSITLRVYAHVTSDQLTEAADIFARAVAATI